MKRFLLMSLICLIMMPVTSTAQTQAVLPADSVIRRLAAGMLMVGFRGDSVTDDCDAARYVRDLHVGGIILFDVDLTGAATIGSRNITSRQRLEAMVGQLHRWADSPMIIAVDQEGGRVARLKPQYGFSPTVSAEYLGTLNNEDTTRYYASRMAREMSACGINCNLAPIADIHSDSCPVIGGLHRAYGADAATIVDNSRWFIDEHHRQGVICALKHFPGHGSAVGDTHYGLVDVTGTWSPDELVPFKTLIDMGMADAIMTAHIYNRNIDPDYPATLSSATVTGLLRDTLGFDGLVITDDLYMEGIIGEFGVEDALVLAINAGADLVCVGNNINTGFEADRPFRLVDMIVNAVKDGRIPIGRLVDSDARKHRILSGLH